MEFEYKGQKCKLEIKKVGLEHCRPEKKTEQRRRDYFSLHFVTHGLGSLHIEGQEVALGKGNVFLLYHKKEYVYYPEKSFPWSYIWVDFYAEGLEELLRDCGFTVEKPYFRLSDYNGMMSMMQQLMDMYDGSQMEDLACTAQLLLIMKCLSEYVGRYQEAGNKSQMNFKRLREILIYINNNYRIRLSIPQIEADMYISEKKLNYLFRYYLDMSPVNYINRFRITNACLLLRETDLMIKDIGQMVGIDDEKYFARLFLKWTGMTAKAYRQMEQYDDPFEWLKEKKIDLR